MPYFDHAAHSNLVRHWKVSPVEVSSLIKNTVWDPQLASDGKSHALKSPDPTRHLIRVQFVELPDFPGLIRIRSINWKAEWEPNGLYWKEDARAFYSILRGAGMVPC